VNVTVTGTATSGSHGATYALTVVTAPTGGFTNGGFETGTLSGWTATGASEQVVLSPHSGNYADRNGLPTPTNGDSKIVQTVTAPAGTTKLSFWYSMTCTDTVYYDWATATLTDNTSKKTTTVLAKVCATGGWKQVTASTTAGHSYTLTLVSHDDNYATDPSYTLFDDVSFQ
jgi:hypothetical protein